MKNKILLFILVALPILSISQSVPNTNTFSMTDVRSAVGGNDLVGLFFNAENPYFDPTYVGVKDRMSNFRNYNRTSLAPIVSTYPFATNVTATSATIMGEVIYQGGSLVTVRGLQYSDDPDMITYTQVDVGSGLGVFSADISGLTNSTIYYYRAFATNSFGTDYGSLYEFNTADATLVAPTVISGEAVNIDETTTQLNGSVTEDGGSMVTERGIVYEYNLPELSNPTTSSYLGKLVLGSGIGSFSGNATGLTASTSYKYRSYAINSVGTSYGNIRTFKTNESGPNPSCPSVGDPYQGGLVAHLFKSGQKGYVAGECHGIILRPPMVNFPWGLSPDRDILTWPQVGWAVSNTAAIVSAYGPSGNYGALLVTNLVADGYSDWVLPTVSDLIEIAKNASYFSFYFDTTEAFWSSNQSTSISSAVVVRMDGTVLDVNKQNTVPGYRNLPIRYF